MKHPLCSLFVWILVCASLVLLGCTSKEAAQEKALLAAIHESGKAFNDRDMEKYAAFYADDCIWDVASSPVPIARSDLIAMILNMPKNDPNVYHAQEQVLISGNFAFFDECSFISTVPGTDKRYRVFHSDILEFEGHKVKVMTTFSDGAATNVALGLIDPPLPAPPLPGTRSWPTAEPQPTKLKPLDAQKESQARWNSHDMASMARMLHTDARILISPLYDPVNRDAFIAWIGVMFKAFPDLAVEATRTFDMGEGWVVSEVKMTGTNSGAYLGHPATGKPIALRAAYAGRYDAGGLATNLKLYFNSMDIMNQLGHKPVPLSAQR